MADMTAVQEKAARRRTEEIVRSMNCALDIPPPKLWAHMFGKVKKAGTGRMHSRFKCAKQDWPCPIHSPSDHHMATWPWLVRYDKQSLTERVCSHGLGHPDPDSLAWLERRGVDVRVLRKHSCDGCCEVGS